MDEVRVTHPRRWAWRLGPLSAGGFTHRNRKGGSGEDGFPQLSVAGAECLTSLDTGRVRGEGFSSTAVDQEYENAFRI